MTLSTKVAIGKPYNVHEVFAFARTLIDTPNGTPDAWADREPYADGTKWMGNPSGLGLAAWLIVRYGVDGPMRHKCDEWCDDETHEWAQKHPDENGWAAIVVDFDTAYSYRGEDGETCSDLHARLVTALGQWLDAKGLPWKWQNEYSGEWFDRYDQLDTFGDAHRATGADDWFRKVAIPAIQNAAGGRL
jgi:hypothetical protein